ncbi:MAG: hypothetical protein AUH37_02560 [Candidatus Nitrososphaera sp. 13_1_40CM_48_12]|nr:MAG: hypothetical protein AUH37_02560 [Candidatus Nitrososphaera sp. 13_1_40CM_48_12]
MNMFAVYLLLLPMAAAFVLGSLYSPAVHASLNPGNEITTASNSIFQSDTFSAAGAIGSLAGDKRDPAIITGKWSLDVQDGAVAGFSTNLTMVNASGRDYRTVALSNLSSAEVIMDANGTAHITGVVDLTIDGTEKLSGVHATISLVKFLALNMTLSEPDYLTEPIYGAADPQEQTVAATSDIMNEGSGIFGGITEKFRLPQLPNPFK